MRGQKKVGFAYYFYARRLSFVAEKLNIRRMNLNQITVPVRDIEAAIPFYKKLGLQLIVYSEAHYARFECPDGSSTFSLHRVADLPHGEGIWVYFECADLDTKVADLQAQGIAFDLLPTDQPWLWREARLRDLDGNRLILYWAGDARLNPPWRIESE